MAHLGSLNFYEFIVCFRRWSFSWLLGYPHLGIGSAASTYLLQTGYGIKYLLSLVLFCVLLNEEWNVCGLASET